MRKSSSDNPPFSNEHEQRLRPLSYSKAHVILIAFAIDTPDSLENVSHKVTNMICVLVPHSPFPYRSGLRKYARYAGPMSPSFLSVASQIFVLPMLSMLHLKIIIFLMSLELAANKLHALLVQERTKSARL